MATKKPNLSETEQRKQEIVRLSKKALQLNKDIIDKISFYRQKGYDIENEYYAVSTKRQIDIILSKSRPNKQDLQKMREYAKANQYDYVKFNKVNYKEIRPEEKKLTKRMNKALQEAEGLYPENVKTHEYTGQLQSLVQELKDKPELAKSGEETEFYSISDEYNPKKEEELYKDIEFSSIPVTPETMAIVSATEQKVRDERLRIERLKEDISNKTYNKNVKNIQNLDLATMYTLENIMNSSAAWNVCKKNADDSDQVKQNWEELYRYTRLAYDNDFLLFDKVCTMIENEADLDIIVNYVDHEIYDMA